MTDYEMVAGLRRMAEEAEEALRGHEANEHRGELCPLERINAVAYLAHRLGVPPDAMPIVEARIVDYAEHHALHVAEGNGHA